MREEPAFLTVDHVLAIHGRLVQEFGGDPSVRDPGLLEAAVMMPAAQYEGRFLHGSIAAMAGAYLFHICQNHPFVDGNKRTALAAAEVFILLNAKRLAATNRDLERLTRAVAEGMCSKDQVVAFFRRHVVAHT
jgi:death-on-curing protein